MIALLCLFLRIGVNIRSLIRPFGLWSQPSQMPSLPILPVKDSCMHSHSVVPHHDCAWCPFDSALQVLAVCQMVIEEFEEVVALLLLEALDVPSELRVDEQRLLASDRMGTDDGMSSGNRLSTHNRVASTCCCSLFVARVDRLQPVQALLELG